MVPHQHTRPGAAHWQSAGRSEIAGQHPSRQDTDTNDLGQGCGHRWSRCADLVLQHSELLKQANKMPGSTPDLLDPHLVEVGGRWDFVDLPLLQISWPLEPGFGLPGSSGWIRACS